MIVIVIIAGVFVIIAIVVVVVSGSLSFVVTVAIVIFEARYLSVMHASRGKCFASSQISFNVSTYYVCVVVLEITRFLVCFFFVFRPVPCASSSEFAQREYSEVC